MKFLSITSSTLIILLFFTNNLYAQNNNTQWMTPQIVGNYTCQSAFYVDDYFAHAIGNNPFDGSQIIQAFYVVHIQNSGYCDLEFLTNNKSLMTVYGPLNDAYNFCNSSLTELYNDSLGVVVSPSSSHPFSNYFQHTLQDIDSGIYLIKIDIIGGTTFGSIAFVFTGPAHPHTIEVDATNPFVVYEFINNKFVIKAPIDNFTDGNIGVTLKVSNENGDFKVFDLQKVLNDRNN